MEGFVKITEKRTVNDLSPDAKLLVTQTVANSLTVRRATIKTVFDTVMDQIKADSTLIPTSGNDGFEIDSPAALQELCATGHIGRWLSVGDIIYIPWTDYSVNPPVEYDYPFVVVHIGDVYDENDVLHKNGLWLMAMYSTPFSIPFDQPENIVANTATFESGKYYYTKSGSSYTAQTVTYGESIPSDQTYYYSFQAKMANALRYGYNRYSKSALRQWLNSEAAPNAGWWQSQHDSDKAPTTTYTNKPGWIYGFTSEWKAIFKPVRVRTVASTYADGGVTDTTYDKFFIPSVEQVYGEPQSVGVEGEYWEYWKNETGFDSPHNGSADDTNDARIIHSINDVSGELVSTRLRTAVLSNVRSTYQLSTYGYVSTVNSSTANRAQPTCVIY